MKRKILFFINPISGTRNKLQLEKKIIKKCEGRKFGFEILYTEKEGNYTFLKEKLVRDEITDVVICGGDGSLRPVISEVFGAKVNIGILPLGSGNGLAFTAKIPRSVDKALEVIFNGKTSKVDAFLINNTLSCMLSGIGLDALVAYGFSLQKKRGLFSYIKLSLKKFLIAKPYPFGLQIQDTNLHLEAYFISIANSNQFGNNFTIAPVASLSDGLLDIVVVKKMNKLLIPWSIFRQMKTGKITRHSEREFNRNYILYLQAKKLRILNPGMAPMHIDGDHTETSKEFNIEILPAAYDLLVP
jgi:YegS/Rv2252/BmrU family lipid kinase